MGKSTELSAGAAVPSIATASLAGMRCGVTGAGGSLGRALLLELHRHGAVPVALRHGGQDLVLDDNGSPLPVQTIWWQVGQEQALEPQLQELDVLVINHGINRLGARDASAAAESLEVNLLSALRLLELFLAVAKPGDGRELWVNTSEAEVNPALSPLYEISKRALGQLLSLRRLDACCTVRRLVLGPFRSELNPYGVMRAEGVAAEVVRQAIAGRELIIVSPNPLTWLLMPLTCWGRERYYRWFTRHPDP
ncbi:MAG: short-chain dehydrogenase [Synechococcus sp. TMED19]|nr:MAG: short-chain dehydrogenase [Synechococcus sp. TMED19]